LQHDTGSIYPDLEGWKKGIRWKSWTVPLR